MHATKGVGIYAIRNTVNGVTYIGSTTEWFGKRWYQHRRSLKLGTHGNRYFQRAWDKYGEGAFIFEIVEHVPDTEDIIAREQFWIEHTQKTCGCYNIMMQAKPVMNTSHSLSDGAKKRIGDAQRGRPNSPEQVALQREIGRRTARRTTYHFVSPDGEVYENITDLAAFCDEHGLNVAAMRAAYASGVACRGWRKLGSEKQSKPTIAYAFRSPDDTEHRDITDLKAFCAERGLSYKNMNAVFNGGKLSHQGWRRVDFEPRPRKAFAFVSPDGDVHDGIVDLKAFCEMHGLHYGSMKCVHNPNQKVQSYKGWCAYTPPEEGSS